MVYLSRIYTKTGDGGETALGDGTRVAKDHPRVAAYGSVDELNAVLADSEDSRVLLFDLDEGAVANIAVPVQEAFDRLHGEIVLLRRLPGCGKRELAPDIVESGNERVHLAGKFASGDSFGQRMQDAAKPSRGSAPALGSHAAAEVPLQWTPLERLHL